MDKRNKNVSGPKHHRTKKEDKCQRTKGRKTLEDKKKGNVSVQKENVTEQKEGRRQRTKGRKTSVNKRKVSLNKRKENVRGWKENVRGQKGRKHEWKLVSF